MEQQPLPECVGPMIEQLRAAMKDIRRFGDAAEIAKAEHKNDRKNLDAYFDAQKEAKLLKAAKKVWERTRQTDDAKLVLEATEDAKEARRVLKGVAEDLPSYNAWQAIAGDYNAAKAAGQAAAKTLAGDMPDDAGRVQINAAGATPEKE